MYIGKLGDGSSPDDGVYILIKEVIDNCIDDLSWEMAKQLTFPSKIKKVIRDYGRGIPLGKLVDVVSKINTGAKYDSKVFKKSVGLNGVGTKAVNALSNYFRIQSIRDNHKTVEFEKGIIINDEPTQASSQRKGTKVTFIADNDIFGNYRFVNEYVEKMLWNYCYLNLGLTILYNGEKFHSENGLKDLLEQNIDNKTNYPIIHLKGDDIELAMTHSQQAYGEQYYSFVNGQHTTQGGTHQSAFRRSSSKNNTRVLREEF